MPKTDFDQIKKIISQITGCCSSTEALALYQAAKKCSGKGVIVEIGSWKGRSTVALGLGSSDGKKVKLFAIDPYTGSPDQQQDGKKIWTLEEFKKNIKNADLSDLVTPIVTTAEKAIQNWNHPIELIYIDANYHDYELTKNLFINWSKYLVEGGVFALHNTVPSTKDILHGLPMHGCAGPRELTKKYIFKSKIFKNVKIAGTITFAEKCFQNTFLDRIKTKIVSLQSNGLYFIHKIYLICTQLPSPLKKFLKELLDFGDKICEKTRN